MQKPMSEHSDQKEREAAVPPIDWSGWLRENGARLLLFARRQARSEADAEDILQEALVGLVRVVEAGEFTGKREQWASYVYTSIVHLAMDYGRREDSRMNRQGTVCREAEHETPEVWFTSESDKNYLCARIESLLKELPPDFAEVVILKIWGEQTFREIAETLGLSLNTVASRYRYGLKIMRRALETSPIL